MDRTIARIEKDLLRRISQILLEVQEPRISSGLVSVSRTAISRDMRVLKCYVTVNHGPQEQQAVMLALRKARRFVRGRLGETLTLRHTPEIRFYLDDTPERAQRIEQILDSLATSDEHIAQAADDEAPGAEAGAGADDPDRPPDEPAEP